MIPCREEGGTGYEETVGERHRVRAGASMQPKANIPCRMKFFNCCIVDILSDINQADALFSI